MKAKSAGTAHLATKLVVLSSMAIICIMAHAFAQGPAKERVSQVVILPLVDARQNKKIKIDINQLRDYTQRN